MLKFLTIPRSFGKQCFAVVDAPYSKWAEKKLTPSGPGVGGGSEARMTNSQLPFKNLLTCDAQTLWISVFIFETCSDLILAKLIDQGVAAALSSSRRLKNFENEKNFFCLKIAETDMGSRFWVNKNDSGHKILFFKLKPFSAGKYLNSMTRSLLEREILWRHISKLERLPDSNSASGMLLWLCWVMQNFISIGQW